MQGSLVSSATMQPRSAAHLSPPIWASSKTWQWPSTSADRAFTLVWMEPPQACGAQEGKIPNSEGSHQPSKLPATSGQSQPLC